MNYKPEPFGKPQIVDIELGPQLSFNPLVLWFYIHPDVCLMVINLSLYITSQIYIQLTPIKSIFRKSKPFSSVSERDGVSQILNIFTTISWLSYG
jgi:hypothetical protein